MDTFNDIIVKILQAFYISHFFSLHLNTEITFDDHEQINKIKAVYLQVLFQISSRADLLRINLYIVNQQLIYLADYLVILHYKAVL